MSELFLFKESASGRRTGLTIWEKMFTRVCCARPIFLKCLLAGITLLFYVVSVRSQCWPLAKAEVQDPHLISAGNCAVTCVNKCSHFIVNCGGNTQNLGFLSIHFHADLLAIFFHYIYQVQEPTKRGSDKSSFFLL